MTKRFSPVRYRPAKQAGSRDDRSARNLRERRHRYGGGITVPNSALHCRVYRVPKDGPFILYPAPDYKDFQGAAYVEVYRYHCTSLIDAKHEIECGRFYGWRAHYHDNTSTDISVVPFGEMERFEGWIAMYDAQERRPDGADWVWGSNDQFPFQKQKRVVY